MSLTKADELELYTKTVASLPDGYIRDILTDLQPCVERAVSNDLCQLDWRFWETCAVEAQEQCKTIRLEAKDLLDQFNAKKREVDRLQRELSELRSQARTVAQLCLS